MNEGVCLWCGASLAGRRKDCLFCCPTHRVNYWQRKQRQTQRFEELGDTSTLRNIYSDSPAAAYLIKEIAERHGAEAARRAILACQLVRGT